MKTLYERIIEASSEVDKRWREPNDFSTIVIRYPVPSIKTHPRSKLLTSYNLVVGSFSQFSFMEDDFIVVDEGVVSKIDDQALLISAAIETVPSVEDEIKTLDVLNERVKKWRRLTPKRIVGVGGGIIGNIAGYAAEQLSADLVLIPTTVIAMSDSSIGGKVRVNAIHEGRYRKHAYKSFYEPSQIFLDRDFLESLDVDQIRYGLAEVIKHALYQSDGLVDYLLSEEFKPFENKTSLFKSILWTADLKRICLEIDPEESPDGSYLILRAAHDLSDRLEEESRFTLSHGKAVLKAMKNDLADSKNKLDTLERIYTRLGIWV